MVAIGFPFNEITFSHKPFARHKSTRYSCRYRKETRLNDVHIDGDVDKGEVGGQDESQMNSFSSNAMCGQKGRIIRLTA